MNPPPGEPESVVVARALDGSLVAVSMAGAKGWGGCWPSHVPGYWPARTNLFLTGDGRWIAGREVRAVGHGQCFYGGAPPCFKIVGPQWALEWCDTNRAPVPSELQNSAPPTPIEAPAAELPEAAGSTTTNADARTGNPERLTPGARAIAAAYDLQRDGKPVSLRAACVLAGVDRDNLRRRFPEAVRTIKALSQPDRALYRGVRDSRTGDVDAWDSDDDD